MRSSLLLFRTGLAIVISRSYPALVIVTFLCLLSACAKPVSYYTTPGSKGYNEQGLGAICSSCGKQYNISGNQLNNVANIKCCYCGQLSNTKEAAARWVGIKKQLDAQANKEILLGILQGASAGVRGYNEGRYSSSYTPTQTTTPAPKSAGCSSDYDCGMGNRCVKEYLQSNGVCMEVVDSRGFKQSERMPDPNSFYNNFDQQGECKFDTDCPLYFRCDATYKVCVKK